MISFILRSRIDGALVLAVAQIVHALRLAHVAEEELALLLWMITGRRWYLLREFGCLVSECFARRSTAKLHLISLPTGSIVVGVGSGDASRRARHMLKEARVLVSGDRVVRLTLGEARLGDIVTGYPHCLRTS